MNGTTRPQDSNHKKPVQAVQPATTNNNKESTIPIIPSTITTPATPVTTKSVILVI